MNFSKLLRVVLRVSRENIYEVIFQKNLDYRHQSCYFDKMTLQHRPSPGIFATILEHLH